MAYRLVCPEWAKAYWNANECSVERCTDGTFVVIDHSLNGVVILEATTELEAKDWLGLRW